MRAARSRESGAEFEREIVHAHEGEGFPARRIPLSGAAPGYPGDVELELGRLGKRLSQCKRRDGADGFKLLYRWLEGHDLLFVRGNRKLNKPLVVLPLDLWLQVARCAGEPGRSGGE